MQRGPRGRVGPGKPGPCLRTSTPARLKSVPEKVAALSAAAPPKEARAERNQRCGGRGDTPCQALAPPPALAELPVQLLPAAMQRPRARAGEWVSASRSPGRGAAGPVRPQASWPSRCWPPRPCSHIAAAPLLVAQGVPQPAKESGCRSGTGRDLPETSPWAC